MILRFISSIVIPEHASFLYFLRILLPIPELRAIFFLLNLIDHVLSSLIVI